MRIPVDPRIIKSFQSIFFHVRLTTRSPSIPLPPFFSSFPSPPTRIPFLLIPPKSSQALGFLVPHLRSVTLETPRSWWTLKGNWDAKSGCFRKPCWGTRGRLKIPLIYGLLPPKTNGWNPKMEVWFRWFSFFKQVISGSMLVFGGETSQKVVFKGSTNISSTHNVVVVVAVVKSNPISVPWSMGLKVCLLNYRSMMVDFYGKCRHIYQSHGCYG